MGVVLSQYLLKSSRIPLLSVDLSGEFGVVLLNCMEISYVGDIFAPAFWLCHAEGWEFPLR